MNQLPLRLLSCLTAITFLFIFSPMSFAADGALEALELRYQAELAIAQERSRGRADLAQAMQESLPVLLQEYLATRDGSIALDTVDDVFVREQFKVAQAMEEPGVALALDVFSGSGTGYEHGLQTAIANLADFNERMAGRVSEAALDAHERVMDRQMDRIEKHLVKLTPQEDQFGVRLDVKLEGMRTVEFIESKAATKVDAVLEKTESRVEAVVEKAVQGVEASPEKTEAIVEKAETKIEKIVSKAEETIDQIVSKAEDQLASLPPPPPPDDEPPPDGEPAPDGPKKEKKK